MSSGFLIPFGERYRATADPWDRSMNCRKVVETCPSTSKNEAVYALDETSQCVVILRWSRSSALSFSTVICVASVRRSTATIPICMVSARMPANYTNSFHTYSSPGALYPNHVVFLPLVDG